MAVVSNKNIQTVVPNNVPTMASNNPVQNQQLAQPTSNIPVVQIPVQIQPVTNGAVATTPQINPPNMANNTIMPTSAQPTAGNFGVPMSANQPIQQPAVQAPMNTQNIQNANNQQYNIASQNMANVSAPVMANNQNTQTTQNQPITTTSNNLGKTTTWTPIKITNNDLTTTEGQYQSAYADTIKDVVNSILNARFEYNPQEDDLLQLATQYATQSTFESMNARGILNSSMTGERVAKVISDLTYQYQELARQDFENEFNRMLNIANVLMNLDQTEYSRWVDNRNFEYQKKQDDYQKKRDDIQDAWNRVDTLGYVDNEASLLIGLPAGTPSKEARQRIEAKLDEIEMYQKKLEMQKQTDMELYKLKAEIDSQYDISNYKEKSAIDINNYQQKAQIDAQYSTGSSSANSSNSTNKLSDTAVQNQLNNYDNIIKNYATKNIDGQYELSSKNKATVLDIIESANKAGVLSDENALILIAKYGLNTGIATNTSNSTTTNKTNTIGTNKSSSASSSYDKKNVYQIQQATEHTINNLLRR